MSDHKKLATDALALAEKATPGPWIHRNAGVRVDMGAIEYKIADVTTTRKISPNIYSALSKTSAFDDADFIAASRMLVPELAHSVLALIEENEMLKAELWAANDALCAKSI